MLLGTVPHSGRSSLADLSLCPHGVPAGQHLSARLYGDFAPRWIRQERTHYCKTVAVVVLVGIGLALVAFGALVLLRFPDRPGGRLRFGGMEVSSVGAGLPLVALGVAAVAVGVLHQPSTPTDTGGGAGGTGGGSGAHPPEPGFVSECMAAFLAADPAVAGDRQRQLNEGLEDVDVLGPNEPKQTEFGLVLADGDPVGVVKTSYDIATERFRFDAMVDRECHPMEWTAPGIPGLNSQRVGNHTTLRLKAGSVVYLLELKAGSEVEMELHRFER